nr:hypothetical protein Iba_scaffold30362CG0070 [Ipomoea batatas]GMD56230.1 hypothetical protein Iba_chr11eCG1200 [Ipomoea batatas]GME19507.1 hypothetical protein Iba_scaffold23045CG0070 [Ipomoea batatas]
MNTDSRSGGSKNSRAPLYRQEEDAGRRFLGAGGQGSLSGILESLDVGVVEPRSSSEWMNFLNGEEERKEEFWGAKGERKDGFFGAKGMQKWSQNEEREREGTWT